MADLKSTKLMYVKAAMLVLAGAMAGAAVVIEAPSWRTAALLTIAVWAFCRAYYFCFYVIERWIDPHFRFAGLTATVVYILRRGRPKRPGD